MKQGCQRLRSIASSTKFGKRWPSLIVDAFAHCGLFPVKNPVGEKEYEKSKNFQFADNAEDHLYRDSNYVLLRTIMSSSKMMSNGNNKKPHTAHVTSPENVQTMKQKKNAKKDAGMKSKVVPKLRIRFLTSKPATDQPGTSVQGSSTEHGETECCVCDTLWSTTSEEWFKCKNCEGWACESCFAVDVCADCL